MAIEYHGNAGAPINGFGQAVGLAGGLGQQSLDQINEQALQRVLQAAPAKEPSPVARELQQLEANVKHLYAEIDGLTRQLAPVIAPQPKADSATQGEQNGIATSPLHRSIYATNVQLTKLGSQVAQLRAALSI